MEDRNAGGDTNMGGMTATPIARRRRPVTATSSPALGARGLPASRSGSQTPARANNALGTPPTTAPAVPEEYDGTEEP